ncbi:hypothetical protein CPB83DRAFT_902843 [Crepidotus variabilis]|uniref:RRM domain-containing protein n=1 Tax=Crepidotus variabilis TaxID=179855 RepID=A0A9P6ERQ5_9AGAR|nr:hypothetical protein CPB83DRAFT_902843 [Crepidotus variabilis]
MSRMVRAAFQAQETSKHILLRNLPRTSTPGDVRRALLRDGVQGVEKIEINYSHFRPTGKALLTMTTSKNSLSALTYFDRHGIRLAGVPVHAEAVYNTTSALVMGSGLEGDGPTAGHESGKTVTLSGLSGKKRLKDIWDMLEGFDVKQVLFSRLPPNKFSLFSRWIVKVNSESEAHRIVRKFHMTKSHGRHDGVRVRAEILY